MDRQSKHYLVSSIFLILHYTFTFDSFQGKQIIVRSRAYIQDKSYHVTVSVIHNRWHFVDLYNALRTVWEGRGTACGGGDSGWRGHRGLVCWRFQYPIRHAELYWGWPKDIACSKKVNTSNQRRHSHGLLFLWNICRPYMYMQSPSVNFSCVYLTRHHIHVGLFSNRFKQGGGRLASKNRIKGNLKWSR